MKKKSVFITISIVLLLIILLSFVILSKQKNNKFNNNIVNKEYEKLTFIENQSLINQKQENLEKKYMKEFKSKSYTIDKPYVVSNPYEVAPLSALIMFKTDDVVSTEIIIKGKNGADDLSFSSKKGKEHILVIYGLYDNYENNVQIKTSDGKSKNITISTIKTEDYFVPEMKIEKKTKNNFILVDTPLGTKSYLYDSDGNIRSYFNNSFSKIIQVKDNGHLLISNGIIENGYSTGILEIDFSGKIYNYYSLQYNMANSSKLLDNGNILYKAFNVDNEITDDFIVEIDKKGKVVRTINVFELMSKIDEKYMRENQDMWGYISGIDYNEQSKEIFVSFWYSSAVVSIDYDSSKINWILSDPTYLSEQFNDLLLKPTSEDFIYPKGNYNVKSIENGFSIFVTNWDIRDGQSCSNVQGRKSYVANYKIDLQTKTISEEYSYGKDLNYYSYALGDYSVMKDNKIILFGRELNNIDYTDINCMLNEHWDLYSKVLILDNSNQIIFDSQIKEGLSKALIYKFNKNINNEFKKSNIYNFEYKNNEVEEKEYNDYKEQIEKKYVYNYNFELNGNKLNIMSDEIKNLILISEDKEVYKYSVIQDEMNYFLLNSYNKYFKIYVEKDGEIYDTESYLYI